MPKYPTIAEVVSEYVKAYSSGDAGPLLAFSTNMLTCALLSDQLNVSCDTVGQFIAVCIIVCSVVFYCFYTHLVAQLEASQVKYELDGKNETTEDFLDEFMQERCVHYYNC
jgi:hypothetical protein